MYINSHSETIIEIKAVGALLEDIKKRFRGRRTNRQTLWQKYLWRISYDE